MPLLCQNIFINNNAIFIKYKGKNMCEEVVENENVLPEYWVAESVEFNASHHVVEYDENEAYIN